MRAELRAASICFMVVWELCAIRPVAAQTPSVTDSAGVRITAVPTRTSVDRTLRLFTSAQLEVGGLVDDPADEFNFRNGFLGGISLSTGALAVIDNSRVRMFAADGSQTAVVGRGGRGPSEFAGLMTVCRTRGDTVVAYDNINRRIAIITRTGELVRELPVVQLGALPDHGCFEDGTFLLYKVIGRSENRLIGSVVRVRTDGVVVSELGSFPMSTSLYRVSIFARGEFFYVADSRTGEIGKYDGDGRLRVLFRSNVKPDRIDADARRRRLPVGSIRNPGSPRRNGNAPRGDSWPYFERVTISPGGLLWIEDVKRDRLDSDVWTAFDSGTGLIGKLIIPRDPAASPPIVTEFLENFVVMTHWDRDGVAFVSKYAFR